MWSIGGFLLICLGLALGWYIAAHSDRPLMDFFADQSDSTSRNIESGLLRSLPWAGDEEWLSLGKDRDDLEGRLNAHGTDRIAEWPTGENKAQDKKLGKSADAQLPSGPDDVTRDEQSTQADMPLPVQPARSQAPATGSTHEVQAAAQPAAKDAAKTVPAKSQTKPAKDATNLLWLVEAQKPIDSGAEATEPTAEAASASPVEKARIGTVRAQFTSAVKNGEPTDDLTHLSDPGKLYFFTELKDSDAQRITHVWTRDGKPKAKVALSVRKGRWRTWSAQTVSPEETGRWTVSVLDGAGKTVASRHLDFSKP